ncbi:MAG: hypothetical protein GY853_06745 [PVC group bacterium]|nr:hypothetical protein [PVC group bacterium]
MGHNRLGHLPKTKRWKQVIRLLENGADLPELAQASFNASLTGLGKVPNDKGFLSILNDIIELASVSRDKNLQSSLYQAGINIPSKTSSVAFLTSIAQKLSDSLDTTYPRSDVGKIAQDAFLKSLTKQVKGKTSSLFGDTEDIKNLTNAFRGERFKTLMHEFYSNFTSRYLTYYLSRELPHHVGGNKRFADLDDHSEFSRQFDLYCRQTVRIADEFTPGWVGKAIFDGDTGPDAVKRYAHGAFKKLSSEFMRSGD